MAQDYNVIILDDDERNARPLAIDSRRPMAGVRRPMPGLVVPPSSRPTLIQSAGGYPRPYYPTQPTVVYQQAPASTGVIAGMTTAELVEIGAQVLAALQPLPGAPIAQGAVETDVENW